MQTRSKKSIEQLNEPKPKRKKSLKTPESDAKTPVWKKDVKPESPLFDFKSRRRSTRVSQYKNKDIYDFPYEANKENNPIAKKKVKRKVHVRKKKLKSSIKNGLLTTDPLFETAVQKSISTAAFYSTKWTAKTFAPSIQHPDIHKSSMPSTSKENEVNDESQFYSNFDGIADDDPGYEASISVANETECTSLSVDTLSLPVLPTSVISARFPGTASTPRYPDERYDFNPFSRSKPSVPANSKEEVKLCFGFDEPEDDLNIGLSPVKKTKQLSILHAISMSTHSNVEEIDPIPTRFTIPIIKSFVLSVSNKDNVKPISKIRCTSSKKLRCTSTKNLNMRKQDNKENKNAHRSRNGTKECDKSVLFDIENDEQYNIPCDSPLKNVLQYTTTKNLSNNTKSNESLISSPEKSFMRPPRKSYDRSSLEAARKKFQEQYAGGYPTTDTDTENENSQAEVNYVTRRKRRVIPKATSSKKPNARVKTYRKKKQPSKENITPPVLVEVQTEIKRGKKNFKFDKSVSDWASDINSHFSEIEDIALVVE